MAGSLTKQGGLTGGLSKPETLKGNLANPHLRGYSAYEVAVENGFEGTEEEWLESLKGQDFTYEDFTEEQLDSLKGDKGDPFVYDDFTDEQLELLKVKGDTGKSAYEVWLDEGNKGTEQDFLNSLKGETNITSKSIADVLGYVPADVNDVDNLSKDVEELKEKEIDLTGYATENYVQSYAQPKGDYAALKHTHSEYLTEHQDLKDYAKKSDIPTDYAKSEHEHDQYLTSIPDEYVTESELANKKYLTSIPNEYITESELISKGYLTEHQSLTDYAKKTELPTKTSQLENDSGFLTKDDNVVVDLSEYSTTEQNDAKYQPKGDYSTVGHTHNEYLTENELSQKGYATESFVTNKIEEAELSGSDVDLSGLATKDELNNKVDKIEGKSLIDDAEIERLAKVINYDDTEIKSQIDSKADKTEIPSKVSQLENDKNYLTSIPNEYITETELNNKGYLTEHQDLTDYAKKEDIPTDYAPKEHEHSKYLTEVPSEYVTETELTNKGYLTNIPSEYVTETELDSKGYLTEHQDLSSYAKTTQIPTKVSQLENDSKYLTSIPSEYVTETELENKKYLTSIPSEYITETELANKKYLTSIPSEYITETELNAKGYLTQHQSLTDYAKKTELPTKTSQLTNDSGYITSIPSEYVTKTELAGKKYLTSVPSEYITESELNAKGYITSVPQEVAVQNNQPTSSALWVDIDSTDEINLAEIDDNTVSDEKTWSSTKISREIVDLENTKANKTEVATMVETEVENEKGNIVNLIIQELQGLPVFGVVDENNKIIVTSQLSDGTYTLMYENEDGTTTEIGTMTIGSGGIVIINLFDKTADGFGNNTRLSSSDGGMKTEGSVNGGVVTNFIHFPNGASGTDTLCFKGIRFDIALSDGNTPIAWRYSSKDQTTKLGAIYINSLFTQQADKMSYDATTEITTYIPNGAILEGEYVRFGGVLADGYTIDDIVITFNQAIE